jgi:site-specific recombinase XerD
LITELKALGTDGFIFVNYLGKKMTAVGAHKILKQTIARAGLSSEISWHWLRHSCASHSLLNGASLESVRKKLGHSSISITNTYIHDNDDASQFIDL